MKAQTTRKRGRPKLTLALGHDDKDLLRQYFESGSAREATIAYSLLLAATGQFTYKEIAQEIARKTQAIEPEDIRGLPDVVKRLSQHRIPGVLAIWKRLAPATQAALQRVPGKGAATGELRKALANDLTVLIRSGKAFNHSHLAHLGSVEELEQALDAGWEGARLGCLNREIITRILEGNIEARRSWFATVSQIQKWIGRHRMGGLDEVMINRHSRPRLGIDSLDTMVKMIKALESGAIKDAAGLVKLAGGPRRIKLTTAERHCRNWQRSEDSPLPERIRSILVNYGFIHRLATEQHPKVLQALKDIAGRKNSVNKVKRHEQSPNATAPGQSGPPYQV